MRADQMPDRRTQRDWEAQRIRKAEGDIRAIILKLANEDGIRAESVEVDTREWTFGNVSILTAEDLDPTPEAK